MRPTRDRRSRGEASSDDEKKRRHSALSEIEQGAAGAARPPRRPVLAKPRSWRRSIAKGEYDEGDLPEVAARREFTEEAGWEPNGALLYLGELRQRRSKVITAFALEGDFDTATLRRNSLRWNGHDAAAACSRFPRWIVVNGWI